MPDPTIHILIPETLADATRSGALAQSLQGIAALARVPLTVREENAGGQRRSVKAGWQRRILHVHGQDVGCIDHPESAEDSTLTRAVNVIASILEHAVDRELAVTDLADEMIGSYEELNMLYKLLPTIATGVHPETIAEILVEETMRTLRCRRVSLLVLNQSRNQLEVLASRGLPEKVRHLKIPVAGTVSGHALTTEESLIVNDISQRPELASMSRGDYGCESFAVVRVVLKAQGEPVGVLTATDRLEGKEFTTRDQSLLEGLAAMGASALLNCRLHSASNRQMVSTIRALASAIDAKDQYTHAHSARVAHLAVATARGMGLIDVETLREVELAGLLHDIGKIGISDTILSKTGPLTPEEFNIVKHHAEIGAGIVEHVEGLDQVARAVRYHHERYDGLGYPAGLCGEVIPIASRLIAVADVFDCLTSDRPYRRCIPVELALQEIIRSKGTQLDPQVVDAFLKIIHNELGSTIMRKTSNPPAPQLQLVEI